MVDVKLCLLQVAFYLAFQHQGPFRQVFHVDAVVEEYHIFLTHLGVQCDVHATGVDVIGNGEVDVGLTGDAGIGRAQREPWQSDARGVHGHRTFQFGDIESAGFA